MFSFCKIVDLEIGAGCTSQLLTKLGDLIPSLSQVGRFGTPEGRFRGGIEGFGTFSWRDLKFGTHPWATFEVWYPQKLPGGNATRHFSGRGEPNRRSWQKLGYQTSGFAKIRGLKRIRGTKPPFLAGGYQTPDPDIFLISNPPTRFFPMIAF